MGAIRPLNLRPLPFGGSCSSSAITYIGANGSSFMSGGSDDRYVANYGTDAVAVTWEILNIDTSNNLYVRFGPSSGVFTAASGQDLDNYFTLKPGESYNFPVFDKSQQVNDKMAGTTYSLLLVTASAGTCDFSGVVTVWDLSDEP